MTKKIIILATEGYSTTMLYNALADEVDISKVIIEEKISRKKILEGRIKKVGIWNVLGQVIFQVFIPKILALTSQERIAKIKSTYELDSDTAIPNAQIINVPSVNSKACIDYIVAEKPDLIIVNGTRIISKKVLNSTKATFVNIHAGITPRYRGVHGGYWAIAERDKDNCGVTVHLVDSGIDTGDILYQSIISTVSKDNFNTYPYLQLGEGIILLKEVIANFNQGELKVKENSAGQSKLWYHPTIWYYIKKLLTDGVK